MRYVIVSRHPAAVEFIKAHAPEFADAQVLAQATPDDVAGAVVAGNLPMYLAALAAAVHVVEFVGAAPRGAEYGLAEMEDAGARIAVYRVLPVVPAPPELVINDGLLPAGRYPHHFFVDRDGAVHVFKGQSIAGVAAIVGSNYEKNGKWSSTTYRVRLSDGASHFNLTAPMHGQIFADAAGWSEAIASLGIPVAEASFRAALTAECPKAAARLTEREADIARL